MASTTEAHSLSFDCIVVGSGNAGSCAALSASDSGCKRVLIIDKCPPEWVGGNGYFTAGAHRTVHQGLQDLLPIVTNVTPELASNIDLEPYTKDDFTKDLIRLQVENGVHPKSDMHLVEALVDNSRDAIQWLADRVKMPFTFAFNRQAYLIEGRQVFWGGMALSVADGGKGVIHAHQKALAEAGIQVWFNTEAIQLLMENGAISGVLARRNGNDIRLSAPAVILACGGFEASPDLRSKWLGDEWAHAKVRGSPYNTGDGISLATSVGAALAGDFKHCHSTCWDADAPNDAGNRTLSNQYTKSGYPLGLMLNVKGKRFVDEGEDFRNFTYAKFGREILKQPSSVAFQIYDQQTVKWLRVEEYGDDVVKKVWADTLEELVEKLLPDEEASVEDRKEFLKTIKSYNEAVLAFRSENPTKVWDPAIKDGLSTKSFSHSIIPPKSNWALPIIESPFLAVKVTCGITFTFGGLSVEPETAAILCTVGEPIKGLFCTGELVGGLFYLNYPGGSGLTAGCVFGRKAGREAAKLSTARALSIHLSDSA
ncbi:FAD/NAD-P-binding domain-containing protein [Abortiporus biennis]|nr:FAD/NAD-P-binding domain-containing protein [Abortiporus biennis]